MVSHVKETTILIVDDEHFMLQSLRRLAPQGVRCKVADSVAGAVEMVRSSVALHGLATDVFLPDGTGFEVVEAWVAKYSDAPTDDHDGPTRQAGGRQPRLHDKQSLPRQAVRAHGVPPLHVRRAR